MPLDGYDLTALAEEARELEGRDDEESHLLRGNNLRQLETYGHRTEDLLRRSRGSTADPDQPQSAA